MKISEFLSPWKSFILFRILFQVQRSPHTHSCRQTLCRQRERQSFIHDFPFNTKRKRFYTHHVPRSNSCITKKTRVFRQSSVVMFNTTRESERANNIPPLNFPILFFSPFSYFIIRNDENEALYCWYRTGNKQNWIAFKIYMK